MKWIRVLSGAGFMRYICAGVSQNFSRKSHKSRLQIREVENFDFMREGGKDNRICSGALILPEIFVVSIYCVMACLGKDEHTIIMSKEKPPPPPPRKKEEEMNK